MEYSRWVSFHKTKLLLLLFFILSIFKKKKKIRKSSKPWQFPMDHHALPPPGASWSASLLSHSSSSSWSLSCALPPSNTWAICFPPQACCSPRYSGTSSPVKPTSPSEGHHKDLLLREATPSSILFPPFFTSLPPSLLPFSFPLLSLFANPQWSPPQQSKSYIMGSFSVICNTAPSIFCFLL